VILVLLGAAACYGALAGAALVITPEDPWLPRPTAGAAWLTLFLVPLLTVWAGGEVVRLLRSPRVLTRHAHPLKRLLTGGTIGVTGSLAGALLVSLFEPVNGGWGWLLMGLGSLGATLAVLAFARRTGAGRCVRCDYDVSGVTLASKGLCPECGQSLMARA